MAAERYAEERRNERKKAIEKMVKKDDEVLKEIGFCLVVKRNDKPYKYEYKSSTLKEIKPIQIDCNRRYGGIGLF